MEDSQHWLLWDGDCGLCAAAAAWVGRRDGAGRFAVMEWQRVPSPPMTPALAEACRQAVHVLTREGTVLRGEAAIFFILGELGWKRMSRLGARVPLVWLTAGAYRLVARHRARISALLGQSSACHAGDFSVNVKSNR